VNGQLHVELPAAAKIIVNFDNFKNIFVHI
jgi:hypothetical protein